MIDRRWVACLVALLAHSAPAAGLKFERIVIDADFPAGYQIEVADVNGDGKPDLVGVGGGTCAWYENPSWKKRIVSVPKDTPDIISSATHDLDGDGRAEIAIAHDFAMNEPKRGKLTLAIPGPKADDPWSFRPIVDDAGGHRPPRLPSSGGNVPSIHRLRWGQVPMMRIVGDVPTITNQLGLIVAPIFGREVRPPTFDQDQDQARIVHYDPGTKPKEGRWRSNHIAGGEVAHAILARTDPARTDDPFLLVACSDGVMEYVPSVTLQGAPSFGGFNVFPIPDGVAPKRGCSEVHLGRLATGQRFLATIEPWHGSEVAVRLKPPGLPATCDVATGERNQFGPRTVLDATLDDGHALWVADVDGDGDDEVFAGHRGKDARVSVYRYEAGQWARTVIDRDITAQDFRGGDLDGDGVPDVVAIGGRSHNVVWYRPIRAGGKPAAR